MKRKIPILNSFPLVKEKEATKKAFTLVELIVVITILAILGTIAFISLSGYSSQARDSSRISDISSIKTSLELYNLEAGKYPIPTSGVDITYSGAVVWNQGTFGKTVYANVSKLDKIPLDPTTDKEYTYSVNSNRYEYQLGGIVEGDVVVLNPSQPSLILGKEQLQVQAGETTATAYITGNYNGLMTKSNSGTTCNVLSIPAIITDDTSITDLQQIVTNNSFVYRGYKNLPSSFKTSKFKYNGGFSFTPNNLIAYSDTGSCASLTDSSSYTARVALLKGLQDSYSGTTLKSLSEIRNILALNINTSSPSNDVINYAGNFVNNNLGGSVFVNTNNTEIFACTGDLVVNNANILNITGLSVNTSYQNSQSGSLCYYQCKANYSGTNCEIYTNPNIIGQTVCETAGWYWVNSTQDTTTGTQSDGFCISPRIGDFGDGAGQGMSWNGYGNSYNGWNPRTSSLDDSGNPYPQLGQTRRADSLNGYTCSSLGTATSNFDNTNGQGDTLGNRMKWLVTNKSNLTALQNVNWITNSTPPNSLSIPALYLSDCIDGVKNLTTDMTGVTYAQYNTNVSTSTDTSTLVNVTYQNRQKYLLERTKQSGSHIPSAYDLISSGNSGTGDGEYYLACNAGKLTDSDFTAGELIWLASIGNSAGTSWGRAARYIQSTCSNQNTTDVGLNDGSYASRFVVR